MSRGIMNNELNIWGKYERLYKSQSEESDSERYDV